MSEPRQDIEDLLIEAHKIAVRVRGADLTTDAFVLAIYQELKTEKDSEPKAEAELYPRLVKMYVKRNDYDDGHGGRNTAIHSRMLVIQLAENIIREIRVGWRTYEALGGKED